jgi:3D-(3,5/4)-trihydroxycyclohexane-1,2-dione acylhydrolase (decyclizing)
VSPFKQPDARTGTIAPMETIRLTTAQALVRFLVAQETYVDGERHRLFAGVFAIFGHGNVLSLGEALYDARADLPVFRGQNEQGMALAAVAYAKAMRRRRIMVATSSVGPGATNMVTAAAVAHANRLPLLLLAGDTFTTRLPDPVLQQVEHFGSPSTTVNDAFRAVTRYWDRITHPAQLLTSLPQAVAAMLDPAECGPAFLGLPQDVQAEAYDFPTAFFEPVVREIPRPRPPLAQLDAAAALLAGASRPLLVAGGGVHYSGAEVALQEFARTHGIPVVETMAGKASLAADDPALVGPIGVTGCDQANRLATEADVVLCVGTRLQDFTTGSWTVFGHDAQLIGINAARYDAVKHRSLPVQGDARETLREMTARLGEWRAPDAWGDRAAAEATGYRAFVAARAAPGRDGTTYAQVVGAVNRLATADDYVVAAAGGFPGELNVNWLSRAVGTFDCEYGFSCMGYELSGAWGARLARPEGDVFAFVGDGSYLMLNSDLYSTVLHGEKVIAVVCDNGGYAVIERLQTGQGNAAFNNMIDGPRVDFAAHAKALGCNAEHVADIAALEAAIGRARAADRTTVIVIDTLPQDWTPGGAFWQVGVPEVSGRAEVRAARSRVDDGLAGQRRGV